MKHLKKTLKCLFVDYSNDPRVLNRESNVTGNSLEITRLWRDTDGDGNPEKYSKDFYTKEQFELVF